MGSSAFLQPAPSSARSATSPSPRFLERRRSSGSPGVSSSTPREARKPWKNPGMPSCTFPAPSRMPSKTGKAPTKARKRACCSIASNKIGADIAEGLGTSCSACLEAALVSKERSANQPDVQGRLPLVLASSGGDSAVAKLLLEHGGEVAEMDGNGMDAFRAGCQAGHLPLLSTLYRHAGSPAHRTSMVNGFAGSDLPPPILIAAEAGRADIVRWLLHHGADISSQDPSGRTAAHVAAVHQQWAVLKVLVRYAADPLAQDCEGDTLLSLLQEQPLLDSEARQVLQLVHAAVPSSTVLMRAADTVLMQAADTQPKDAVAARPRPVRALFHLPRTVAMIPVKTALLVGRVAVRPRTIFAVAGGVAATAAIQGSHQEKLRWLNAVAASWRKLAMERLQAL